jgi:hypothetical protein
MLRNLSEFDGYKIHAIDGEMGAVHDLLFDDRDWAVRYLVVKTGTWWPGRKVLISPVAIRRVAAEDRQVRLMLTRDQVKDAPGVETDPPVSRQEERRLVRYYGWPSYWGLPLPSPAAEVPPEKRKEIADELRRARAKARDDDPHLRSVREVAGYRIEARDGAIGHVHDCIGDDSDWVVRYLVIDTRNWLPGKHVPVSPTWVSHVDWKLAQVHLDLDKKQVADAPEYDPSMPISRDYEARLYDHYGRPAYWSGATVDESR